MRIDLKRALSRIAKAFFVFFALLLATTIITLPAPSPVISLSAQTETLEVQILNRDEGAFHLETGRLGSEQACLEEITVRPEPGSTVFYTRTGANELIIFVEGSSSYSGMDTSGVQTSQTQFENLLITTGRAELDCRAPDSVRLPVNGLLSVGLLASESYASETPFLLLQAEAVVHARAVDRAFFGLVPISWFEWLLPVEAGGIFEVGRLAIPAGSRVQSFHGGQDTVSGRWWGFADINFAQSDTIKVHASANTDHLLIFAPAPRTIGSGSGPASLEPDVLSVAALARLTGDPNLQWLYILGGALSAIFAVLAFVLFPKRLS